MLLAVPMDTRAQMPTSNPIPKTGGNTVIITARQSTGTRSALVAGNSTTAAVAADCKPARATPFGTRTTGGLKI